MSLHEAQHKQPYYKRYKCILSRSSNKTQTKNCRTNKDSAAGLSLSSMGSTGG